MSVPLLAVVLVLAFSYLLEVAGEPFDQKKDEGESSQRYYRTSKGVATVAYRGNEAK